MCFNITNIPTIVATIIKQINTALKLISSDGTYDSIYSKSFFPKIAESSSESDNNIFIGIIIFTILIIIVLYIYWIYNTKKKSISTEIPLTQFINNIAKVYESLPTPTVLFDLKGYILFMNKSANELMNSNKNISNHHDEHTLFNYTILSDEMIEDLTNNKPLHFTYNLISKDSIFNYLGDYILPSNHIFDIHIIPIGNDGAILNGYITYIYDITDDFNKHNSNLKLITSLSQISDNNIAEHYFYDAYDNAFFTVVDNKIITTGFTYDDSLQYIHPISRSLFIDEFLSILNGEKKKAKININRKQNLNSDYTSCEIGLNAIKKDSNTTLGISIITISNEHRNNDIDLIRENIDYIFEHNRYILFEYNINNDLIKLKRYNLEKSTNLQDAYKFVHANDIIKINETINDLKNRNIERAYLVVRFALDNAQDYSYYEIHVKLNNNDTIIGVCHDITEQLYHLQELEEFKDCAIKVCELNKMSYIEYYVDEFDNLIIPFNLTEKYGIDDENITTNMDTESLEKYQSLLSSMKKQLEIDNTIVIKTQSPKIHENISLEFNLISVKDENKHTISKYIGFVKDNTYNDR